MEKLSEALMSFQASCGLETTGILDQNTADAIDRESREADNIFSFKPKASMTLHMKLLLILQVFKKKSEEPSPEIESNDIHLMLSRSQNERIRYLWTGKMGKNPGADAEGGPASLAEGFIQGSKEIGKSLLRGVGNSDVGLKTQ